MDVYNIKADELIKKLAEELKKIEHIKPPTWAKFVKTGMHKERPPMQEDWWYTRTATILRRIYLQAPIGVSKLRKKFGGRKNRGHKPEKVYMASGNIIRKILQQLEKAELVEFKEKSIKKGRIISKKGRALLNSLSKK